MLRTVKRASICKGIAGVLLAMATAYFACRNDALWIYLSRQIYRQLEPFIALGVAPACVIACARLLRQRELLVSDLPG
jgi:hypothetical protein